VISAIGRFCSPIAALEQLGRHELSPLPRSEGGRRADARQSGRYGHGVTALADQVVGALQAAYGPHRDAARASGMAAYMRDQFPFLGLSAPEQRRVGRAALAGLAVPKEADVRSVAQQLWRLREREYQYAACDYIVAHVAVCGPTFLEPLERLITTKSWWDTVDVLCRHGAGVIVLADRTQRVVMDRWVESDNVWLARSAILHQERWKAETDAEVLFDYCLRRAKDTDFFIRKAIGWALRSYAHVDTASVLDFLDEHGDELAPLSRREALKRVDTGVKG
jgi:3-methyladenine DNA glycosylase AlkD